MIIDFKTIFRYWHLWGVILVSCLWLPSVYALSLPIKELVRIGSMRENQLTGYGLVVGLPQTGDTRSALTTNTLKKILSSKGAVISDAKLKTKNIAVVMVTAKIPAVALPGNAINIWVSSIGNAKSLTKGYLLQTPLSGADGLVYAVAQGSILSSNSMGGKKRGGSGQNNKETTAFISNGAIIEKKIVQPLILTEKNVRVVLLNLLYFDVSTANNIINGINQAFSGSSRLRNDGSIVVKVPEGANGATFISTILKIPVVVDNRAKVVLDPRSGTIVMGGNVGLSPVAVSKSGMIIRVSTPQDQEQKEKDKKQMSFILLEESPTVSELVDVLNKLGLDAREIIDILKAIHSAGALHAELLII